VNEYDGGLQIASVKFVDEKVGYAVGNFRLWTVVLVTVDGGDSWNYAFEPSMVRCTPPPIPPILVLFIDYISNMTTLVLSCLVSCLVLSLSCLVLSCPCLVLSFVFVFDFVFVLSCFCLSSCFAWRF
jgi:hypothetical protein